MKHLIKALFMLTMKRTQCKINTARLIVLWLGWLVLAIAFVQPAAGQEITVHISPFSDDGDLQKDADGTINDVVVWKGGAVHVVTSYHLDGKYTLRIEPGAVVKFASEFRLDANGRVESWQPALDARIVSDRLFGQASGGIIQINGATLTDIRDDNVGGDTNGDGNQSLPPGPNRNVYFLRFSGSNADVLTGSTIKYCTKMGGFGSITITGNTFFSFGGLKSEQGFPGDSGPIVFDAVPIISNNTFELWGGLNLTGMSPVVQNNILRGGAGITIGPWVDPGYWAFGSFGPKSGTTIISNNTFQDCFNGILIPTTFGDTLYSKVHFRAEISDNKLRGNDNAGSIGLQFVLDADARVTGNEVANFAMPLRLVYNDLTKTSRLQISRNQFSLEGVIDRGSDPPVFNPKRLWQDGQFVQAEGNFWGHPTGPLDQSNVDGLFNQRGKGIRVSDGINYAPFIGGSAPPVKDKIFITVSSNPIPPLTPNSSVTFNVSATYQLESAANGQIFVNIRDDNGYILNSGQGGINVTSQNQSANFPPIQIQVPELTSALTVEAALAPDGEDAVSSSVESFKVQRPASNFSMRISPANFTRGSKTKANFTFNYNLATANNGRFEVELKERVRDLGTDLKNFPSLTVDAPPGNNKTATSEVELDIPLRDVLREPPSELYCQVTFRDGAGVAVGKEARSIPIVDGPNTVRFEILAPGKFNSNQNTLESFGRIHYLVGELPSYAFRIHYRIGTPNVTGWQVRVGDDRALDAAGTTLYQYTASRPAVENASTGLEQSLRAFIVGQGTPLPVGTQKYRAFVRLVAPGDITVAYAIHDVEVRDQPVQSAQKAVPVGASQVTFTPVPVTLNFASNQKAGTAFAEEFAGQFGSTAATSALAKANDFYWQFIPLKRYWAVYDTLKDGTFSATVSFTYDPATDFPAASGFNEDSLVVTGLNPLSEELEALPSTLNKATHTITTDYTKFFDTYVVASKSTVIITAVSSRSNADIPERFALEQNYPNPFNPSTTIAFSLPRNSRLTLKVYNLLGKEVATLVDKKFAAGRYEVHWDASGHANGIYFYRLITEEGFVLTRKLLLVK
jgi:hypothetical protein